MTQQLLDQFFGFFIGKKLGEFELVLHDVLVYLISPFRMVPIGQVPAQELKDHHSQRP